MSKEQENHPKIHQSTRLGETSKSGVALRDLVVALRVGGKSAVLKVGNAALP